MTRFGAAHPFAFILALAHACALAFSALAFLDAPLHALTALMAEFQIAFRADLLLARLAALLAYFGISIVAELCLADLVAHASGFLNRHRALGLLRALFGLLFHVCGP